MPTDHPKAAVWVSRVAHALVVLSVLLLCVPPASAADGPRPAVGDEAPDFTLPTSEGETLTLSSLRGQKKVLLVFFRGTW